MDLDNLQCLSRLRNLKSITWVFPPLHRSYVKGDGLPEDALSKAFESFEVKPKIQVMDGEFDYGNNSRWPSGF
jgi:hypothetical protein